MNRRIAKMAVEGLAGVSTYGGTARSWLVKASSLVMLLSVFASFSAGTLAVGCGTWYSGLRENPVEVSDAYASALHGHTRQGWRSKGFDGTVSVTATLWTADFDLALRVEQARMHFPYSSADQKGARTLPSEEAGVSVVVFIEAPNPALERLDRAEPAWRFYLEVNGERQESVRVAPLDVRDATVVHLFPYVNRFGRAWLLTFPLEKTGRHPVLWMTGAPARFRLEFDL